MKKRIPPVAYIVGLIIILMMIAIVFNIFVLWNINKEAGYNAIVNLINVILGALITTMTGKIKQEIKQERIANVEQEKQKNKEILRGLSKTDKEKFDQKFQETIIEKIIENQKEIEEALKEKNTAKRNKKIAMFVEELSDLKEIKRAYGNHE